MSEQQIELPALEHGFVKGRFVLAKADSLGDGNRYPDLLPEQGQVQLIPQHVIYLTEGPEPATVEGRPIPGEIDERGYLVDPESEEDQELEPGMWLAVGRYTVELMFAGMRRRRSFGITVKPEHTKENPLHLTLAEPQTPAPGTTEITRIIDRQLAQLAAEEAQGYRDEAETFRDEAQLATQGADAYEVAVQQGYEGTRDEWLESLVGPMPTELATTSDPGLMGTEHVSKLETAPSGSGTSVTIHVSPNGDDSANGGASTPVKTLAEATSRVPDIVKQGHSYRIRLLEGEWDEDLELNHRTVYGLLCVEGSTDDRSNHKVRSVSHYSIIGQLQVRDITTTVKDGSGPSFRFSRCSPHVLVYNCDAEGDPEHDKGVTGVIGFLADYGSNVMIRNSNASHKRYGIRSNYLSRVFSRDNTGENNTFGMGVRWGGILSSWGTQPNGDTMRTNSSGGLMLAGQGERSEVSPDERGLIASQQSGNYSGVRKSYILNSQNAGIGTTIPTNAKVRLHFVGPAEGFLFSKIAFHGKSSTTAGRHINAEAGALLRNSTFNPTEPAVVVHSSVGMIEAEPVQVIHSGSNRRFYIDILPYSAQADTWTISVKNTMGGTSEAPILENVELITS
ncbi:right-handed parallel beta-helix repeat-containing protein [Nesterenkonia haasae]|uniref:right-handed parallel beta-helix repeat-containing protein n=1 Tax=Nesterenkonia haasae TaxID=2587813 RepID=UPI001391E5AD|nr:right-handed parallel beta-helix repeat-containing protein [Nesterenkonia haasae]NDK31174.1 right-handed parallel beta-helix repeat-containing protein [Nesterenkonia haasae]